MPSWWTRSLQGVSKNFYSIVLMRSSPHNHSSMHGASQYLYYAGRCHLKKLDLSLDESGGKRNRDELRKLLQMRDCLSIRDASRQAARIRDALCEKLWLEKQTGKVSFTLKNSLLLLLLFIHVVSTLHKLAAKLLPIC